MTMRREAEGVRPVHAVGPRVRCGRVRSRALCDSGLSLQYLQCLQEYEVGHGDQPDERTSPLKSLSLYNMYMHMYAGNVRLYRK